MIVKFFKHGTGVSGGIDYLLNDQDHEKKERSVAPVVQRGDAELTKQVIDSISFKNRYKSGVLSFEESEIEQEKIDEIIDEFEKAIFCGLEKDRYNALWVQHEDKGRVELHFVFPCVDLQSRKAYNPYYHAIDQKRVNAFKDLVNEKYGFSSPNDEQKQQLTQVSNGLPTDKKELLTALNEHFSQMLANGQLKNGREDVIQELKNQGFEIKREGEKYLTIQVDSTGNSSKDRLRLKGELYEQHFKSDSQFEAKNGGKSAENRERNQPDFAKIQLRYEQAIADRAAKNIEKYGANEQRTAEFNQRKNDEIDDQFFTNSSEKFAKNEQRAKSRAEITGGKSETNQSVNENELAESTGASGDDIGSDSNIDYSINEVSHEPDSTTNAAESTTNEPDSTATTSAAENKNGNVRREILQHERRAIHHIATPNPSAKNHQPKQRNSFKNQLTNTKKGSNESEHEKQRRIKMQQSEAAARAAIDFAQKIANEFAQRRADSRRNNTRNQHIERESTAIRAATKSTGEVAESTNSAAKSTSEAVERIRHSTDEFKRSANDNSSKIESIDRLVELAARGEINIRSNRHTDPSIHNNNVTTSHSTMKR